MVPNNFDRPRVVIDSGTANPQAAASRHTFVNALRQRVNKGRRPAG